MRLIIDAMGGDNAPEEIVKGAVTAQKELGVDVTLVGRKEQVIGCLKALDCTTIQVADASEVITMEDDPSTATRRKKDSSMAVALTMLKNGEGDAVISAGSTGALLTGATLTVKRIHGIRRAAMAPVLPCGQYGAILIDCGANVECTPEYLLQFAYMGSFYAKKLMGCPAPRVGLLNVGTEDTKGDELRHETYKLLKAASDEGRINFIGNVEGTGVYEGRAEVVVADGFSGNVFLKTTEGAAKYIMDMLKGVFTKNLGNKLAGAIVKKDLKTMKKALDPNEVGGTALLGISKPVIKAHGSSKAQAIVSAAGQAVKFVQSGIIDDISQNIDVMRVTPEGEEK